MLKGKTILITGGSSGIGKALTTNLSKDNTIIICGRNEDKLKMVATSLQNVSYHVVDITVPKEIDRLFQRIADDGIVLDTLFNNAGVIEQFEVLKTNLSTEQIFEKVNTNLSAGIAIAQQFIKQSNQAKENLIVNVTTEIAIFPIPMLSLYSSSKAGFSVYTKTLRQQLRNTNFKVIEILPPQVDTQMPKQIGNTSKGMGVNDFALKTIEAINKGKMEYAPGSNVFLLKLFRKFLPYTGIKIVDKMSRKMLKG